MKGKLLPGVSADWQILLPDGTAVGDLRYTLQTDSGALLYVQSNVSAMARMLMRASTPFAHPRRSRPRRASSPG